MQAIEATLSIELSRHCGYHVRFVVMEIGARVIEEQIPNHEDPLPTLECGLEWKQLAFAVFTLEGMATIRSGEVSSDPMQPRDVFVSRCVDPKFDFTVAPGQAYAFVGGKCACLHGSTGSGRRTILVVRGYTHVPY